MHKSLNTRSERINTMSSPNRTSGQNILKRSSIEHHLRQQPELTDRAIARLVNIEIEGVPSAHVAHATVAAVRKEAEENGSVPHTTERFELDGRKARGRKVQ